MSERISDDYFEHVLSSMERSEGFSSFSDNERAFAARVRELQRERDEAMRQLRTLEALPASDKKTLSDFAAFLGMPEADLKTMDQLRSAIAAAYLAAAGTDTTVEDEHGVGRSWKCIEKARRCEDVRRNLVQAGALIVAELDRLSRGEQEQGPGSPAVGRSSAADGSADDRVVARQTEPRDAGSTPAPGSFSRDQLVERAIRFGWDTGRVPLGKQTAEALADFAQSLLAPVQKALAGWQHEAEWAKRDLETAKAELRAMHRERHGEVWFWQRDGADKLESLACPVLIDAADLRAELARARQGGAETIRCAYERHNMHEHPGLALRCAWVAGHKDSHTFLLVEDDDDAPLPVPAQPQGDAQKAEERMTSADCTYEVAISGEPCPHESHAPPAAPPDVCPRCGR